MIVSMKRLFLMADEYRGNMILAVVLAVASVAAGMIPYFLISWFVAQLVADEVQFFRLLPVAARVGFFLVVKSLLFVASTMTSHKAAYRILKNTRLKLTEKLTRLPLGFVLERDLGIIKKVMENDVEELERFLAHNIPETTASLVVPVAVTLYLFVLDWRMALALLVCIPVAGIFYGWMMNGSKEKMKRYYEAVDHMNAVVVEYVNGMKEIKAFNQSAGSFARYREAISGYRKYVLDWYRATWPLMSAYYVLIQASLVTVLPVGLYLLMRGTLAFPVFVLFVLVAMGFAAPLLKLAEFADGIMLVVQAEQNIDRILAEAELASGDVTRLPAAREITFEQVSFSYDGNTDILKDVSFTAGEGRSLAIVGESGSGKSTIARLICRFWDVGAGRICIGGMDIRKLNQETLMELVSFVFQDTFLFNISIGDNIRVGRPGATDAEVMAAAQQARCHEFIMKLPTGYDTLAGDGGNRLSGGERQRICIARAILKDAPILILDEATASVDPDCEEQIQEAIGALAKGKTLIVIAHRIRTIMNFDSILVVGDGRICAQGTHGELLAACPEYERMYRAYTETEHWVLGTEREVAG